MQGAAAVPGLGRGHTQLGDPAAVDSRQVVLIEAPTDRQGSRRHVEVVDLQPEDFAAPHPQ